MDTGSVAPVGSVVAPTTIVDRGGQRRRKQDEGEHEPESDEATTEHEKSSHESPPHEKILHAQGGSGEVRRDEDGHIDCYG